MTLLLDTHVLVWWDLDDPLLPQRAEGSGQQAVGSAQSSVAATARCHGLYLLTTDKRIRESGVVALAV